MFLFFYLAFLFCSVERVDGVAAVVEKEVILNSDVQQQLYLMSSQGLVDKNNLEAPSLVLSEMIKQLVLYDLASKDTNLIIDPGTIEENLVFEMKKRIELAGSILELERVFGEPLSMVRAKLRKEIEKNMKVELFTSSLYQTVNPSLLDVRLFYEEFKDSLPLLGPRVSFSVYEWPISIAKEKEALVVSFLANLKDSLSGGASFSLLAQSFSDDVGSAASGGSLGFTLRGSLVPEYEEVAFGLVEGEVSDPFRSPFGYHIVLLEERLGEKIKSSHILRSLHVDDKDIKESSHLFRSFLDEHLVDKYVNKFDSLCSHNAVSSGSFQGVFRSVPLSSVPGFVDPSYLVSLGFSDLFVHKNNLYLIRVFNLFPKEKQTLQNNYLALYNQTKSRLVLDELNRVINNHAQTIHVKSFY